MLRHGSDETCKRMDRLISRYKNQILQIAEKRGVRHVRLFGSMARGESSD